jgi:hypothetical protein
MKQALGGLAAALVTAVVLVGCDRPIRPGHVRLRYLLPQGSLALRSLRLDTTELTTLSTRFRPVHRFIEENRYVLPRAYLVPAVSFVPERAHASLAWSGSTRSARRS